MTFEETFKAAMSKITVTECDLSGRRVAEDLFVDNLNPFIEELIKKSKWERGWVSNPYGRECPYIFLSAHTVNCEIPFKVKLKKTGKKHSWYSGDETYYMPVASYTVDEKLMSKDVFEYIETLYDNDERIKRNIEKENQAHSVAEQYKDLIDRYNSIAKEIKALPDETKRMIREAADLNYMSWY